MNLFIYLLMSVLTPPTLTVTSTAFAHQGYIPPQYTCEGQNINPPLVIKGIPAGAKSVVLIMDDPDAPGTFDHWVVWNIKPATAVEIKENDIPGTQGKNGAGENKYKGPCPPQGTHRYFFKVYALGKVLSIAAGADKKTIEKAMEGHILAKGELIGLFQKVKK